MPTFYTSYKGWKQYSERLQAEDRCPFYTSYKGWKLGTELNHKRLSVLFILPIRDGNMKYWTLQSASISPFYTSYKGWKLLTIGLESTLIDTFYTSYKGWKQEKVVL